MRQIEPVLRLTGLLVGSSALAHVVLAVAGCGGPHDPTLDPHRIAPVPHGSSAPSASSPNAPVPIPASLRSAKLYFEINGKPFPLPLLRGSIAGEPTWMLVDTGANSHVVSRWLAKKAKLAIRPLEEAATDHAGKAVKAFVTDDAAIGVEGWGPLAKEKTLITDFPEPIERLGIGAFISPQWLTKDDDEAVLLDLVNARVALAKRADASRLWWNDDMRDLPSSSSSSFAVLAGGTARACDDSEGTIPSRSFLVQGLIEQKPVTLLVDTGAHNTDVLTASKVGVALAPRSVPSPERLYTVSNRVETRIVKGANVSVGQVTRTTDVVIVPGMSDRDCPRDGVIAMDILRSCILVFSGKQFTARYQK